MKIILNLCCVLVFSQAHPGLIDKDGMQEWEVCALCHSLDGISRMAKFPKLAGQNSQYIAKQFYDFHQARRTNDGGQMEAITTEVDLSRVAEIADYFSQLPPPPAKQLEKDPDSLARFSSGENIFYTGLDSVPACASCHGQATTSSSDKKVMGLGILNPSAPWLFGQHEDYLVKQLIDFRSEERSNDASNAMHRIAKELDIESIRSVAFYLARIQPRKAIN